MFKWLWEWMQDPKVREVQKQVTALTARLDKTENLLAELATPLACLADLKANQAELEGRLAALESSGFANARNMHEAVMKDLRESNPVPLMDD